jgi:hypothetical protein
VSASAGQLTWTDANASSYRILIWDAPNAEPREFFTTGLAYTVPNLSSQAVVVIEGYDALGNSVFSGVAQ